MAGRMPAPQGFQQSLLFPDRVSGAIAASPFPDHARIVEQVSAIDFGKFMCFCATRSVTIMHL